jgi:hypothetical protein
MPRCAASKPNGEPCERIVGATREYCFAHDPTRKEQRSRNASKGGKSKGNRRLAELDKQLEKLATGTLEGEVERGTAAVVNQIINTRIRLIEQERKIKEIEEIAEEQRKQAERMAALESVLKVRPEAV